MKSNVLAPNQMDALNAIVALAGRLGWQGETVVVEGTLVYQVPLPTDPDVSGAFFAVDPDEFNIRLYLTFPLTAPSSRMTEASEFVIRNSYGRKFGTLELDLEHGTLRVRIDTDATEDTIDQAVVRLLDRAMELAREVSPSWRKLCKDQAQGDE